MRVVLVGECMVEMAERGEPGDYRMGFAGDTFNTAWHLRQLFGAGPQIDYLTALGDDATSDRMCAFFAASGIGTAHVQRLAGLAPGLYIIGQQNGDRVFSYWRGQSAARLLAEDAAALARGFAGADLIYLSGITLAILRAEARARLWSAIIQSGARVCFDPNIRPRLWSDPETCRAALTEAAARSWAVLPSFGDEQALFGDVTPAATAARYLAAGAGVVVVKDAAEPAYLAEARGGHSIAPPPLAAPVVDATGAGDAFNAGWLAATLSGQGGEAAVLAGHARAAAVLQVRGALLPL